MKLDHFLFESSTYLCGNIETLKEPKKVCEVVESPQKTVKKKKNGQFVLENQSDLKPEKHTKLREKKIHDSKNGSVTGAFFLKTQVYQ